MTLEDHLKRTQYHWILGLRELKEPCNPNLWDQIHAMQPDEIDHLRYRQVEIRQRSWPLRVYYWLFNRDGYAEHHHQIAAYDQLHEPRNKGIPMYKPKPSQTSYLNQVKQWLQNFTSSPTIPSSHPPPTRNSAIKLNFPEDVRAGESQDPPVVNHPAVVSNSNEELLVQPWMQSSLGLLGIERLDQHILRSSEVKKAYLAQALAFHPDKNPSPEAQVRFVQIANAYETLKAAFCGTIIQDEYSGYEYADVWRTQAELHRDFAGLRKGFQDIIQQCKTDLVTLAENQQKLDKGSRMLDESNRMLDENSQKIDILKQLLSKRNGKLNQNFPVVAIQTKEENRSVRHEIIPIVEPIERPITLFFDMNSIIPQKGSTSVHRLNATSLVCPVVNEVHPVVVGSFITRETLFVQPEMQSLLALLRIEHPAHGRLHLSEVTKAYRAQALIFHPDKNQSSEAQAAFVQIDRAYETLKANFCDKGRSSQFYPAQLQICDKQIDKFERLARGKNGLKFDQYGKPSILGMFSAVVEQQKSSSDEQPKTTQ